MWGWTGKKYENEAGMKTPDYLNMEARQKRKTRRLLDICCTTQFIVLIAY